MSRIAQATLLAAGALAPALSAHAPHDVIQEVAISPAFAQDHTLFATVELTDVDLFARSTDGGVTWQVYGTPMVSADGAAGFAFSPAFAADGTAFAATDAGVWRTTDRGDTWTLASAGLTSLHVNGVAVSPAFATDGVVLAATAAGMARSTDGGLTWGRVTAGPPGNVLQRVAFAPPGPGGPVAFCAGKTVYRSDNAGATWVPQVHFSNQVETLVVSPRFWIDQTVALAFGRFGSGVRVSTNGGTNYALSIDGLADPFVMELAIATDSTTFAATKGGQCFRAATPLSPWAPKNDGFEPISSLTTIHSTECVVSPAYAADHRVFVAGYEGLYRSSDDGDEWRQANVYSQQLNRHLVFSPAFAADRLLFTGNYGGGVFAYHAPAWPPALPPHDPQLDGAPVLLAAAAAASHSASGLPLPAPWDHRSNSLSTLYSDALAISPDFAADQTLFYGYSDLRRSTDAGLHWTALPKPSDVTIVRRVAVSPDFARDRVVFIGSAGEGVFKSTDAGDTWTLVQGGLPQDILIQSLRFSPDWAADGTLFLGSSTAGLWRSQDFGQTWAPSGAGIAEPWVRAIDTSPDFAADPAVLAGTLGGGVYVSHDGGDNWEPHNDGLPRGTPLFIEALACSPAWLADHTAFIGTRDHGVFRTTNGGDDWAPVGDGLPAQLAVRSLAVSPAFAVDRTVVIGTYEWAFLSRDAGDHWERLPGWIRADDGHPSVFHSELPAFDGGASAWKKVADPLCMAQACAESTHGDDWEEYEFTGSRIEWWADTGPSSGFAGISIDAVPVASLDLYSAAPGSQQLVFARDFPAAGPHVIRVTNRGVMNPASTGIVVRSDGYVVRF